MRSPAWLTPFIKDFGPSTEVRSQSFRPVLCDELGNPAVRVIQVAEDSYLSRTGAHTRRFFALTNQVYAEPTFYGNAFTFVHETDLVRAGFYTVFATDAPVSVNQHNSFRRGINGAGRTNALTWSIFAMVALHRNKFFGERRKFPPFLFSNPVERMFVVQILLILAGNPAGMASYTFAGVNSDSVSRHIKTPVRTLSSSNHLLSRGEALSGQFVIASEAKQSHWIYWVKRGIASSLCSSQ
jgi:hypothetical protein